MATLRSTARRYAEAALSLAERDGSLGDWVGALDTASARLADAQVMRVLADPAIAFDHRRRVAEAILADAVVGEPRNLVLLLVRRGRIELLPTVAGELRRLWEQRQGIVHAVVTSATPLAEADRDAIRDKLAAMTGDQVDIELQVDPSLLGGVLVRMGDRLIDGSVRGRLERLRARLASGVV
ncbi:MAG: ATP synthase F1 subunit delta [Chloroflexota bacterium]